MILERFIAKRFASLLSVTFFGLTGLYLLIDAFETLPDFLDKHISFLTIVVYFALISPKIIYQLSPLVILLSGLLTIITLGKGNQILAMRSIGISPNRIFRPIMLLSLFLALLFTSMHVFLVPKAQESANFILSMELGKNNNPGMMLSEGRLFYKGKNFILSAELVLPDATELKEFEWLFFDQNYQVLSKLFAKRAIFKDDKWRFEKAVLSSGTETRFYPTITQKIGILPKDLLAVETPVEEASPHQLFSAIRRLREIGLPYFKQQTVLMAGLAYSFLGASLLYLCLPIAFYRIHGNASLGLVIGTIVAFSVWALWNMLISMGKAGAIPPFIAVFSLHLILILSGHVYKSKVKF